RKRPPVLLPARGQRGGVHICEPILNAESAALPGARNEPLVPGPFCLLPRTPSMATTVFIPTPLRPFTDQQATVQVAGANVGEVLQNLVTVHPDLKNHLYNADGKLRSFVNVYVNDEDIRYLKKDQ